MKIIYKICGVLLVLGGLLLTLVSPIYLLFVACGVGLFLYKPKEVVPEAPVQKPRAVYKDFKLLAPENIDQFYKEHKDEREENPDYFLNKSELLEEYSDERVYKYEEAYFDAEIKGKEVWCDGVHLGHINRKLEEGETAQVVLCGGPFKYVGEDEVEKVDRDYWLYVEVKKMA